MQKILLAIDAMQLNMTAIDFVCYLGRLTKSNVTGVFLENLVADEKWVLTNNSDVPYISLKIDKNSEEYHSKQETIEKNISFFKEACCAREVNCHIHRDRGLPIEEIIQESRFADVIVADVETSFNRRYDGAPTEFIQDLLKQTECPIIVAPKRFDSIDEIIFAYDGSRSAMFALKQFNYLFPELNKTKFTLLEVSTDDKPLIEQKHKVKEWINTHYINNSFELLSGKTKKQLLKYLSSKQNAFVIMGSYGRKDVSRLFKRSAAEAILKITSLPVFIAHF